MNELVSVIVPVYNAQKCIDDTILSVINQTYTNWELLLCDDGSTDQTVSIMRRYESERVHILEKNSPDKGAACARNRGIQAASGRYIAFIDADDLWHPDKLTKQLAFMEDKDAAFSCTSYEFGDENGKGLGKFAIVPEEMTYREALGNTTIFTSTVIFDLDKLDKELIYMPHVPSEDTATWWKVLRSGYKVYGLKDSMTIYRRMGSSLSSNKLEAIRRIWNLYRNVEHLSVPYSMYCFGRWAVGAVRRRL